MMLPSSLDEVHSHLQSGIPCRRDEVSGQLNAFGFLDGKFRHIVGSRCHHHVSTAHCSMESSPVERTLAAVLRVSLPVAHVADVHLVAPVEHQVSVLHMHCVAKATVVCHYLQIFNIRHAQDIGGRIMTCQYGEEPGQRSLQI